MKRKRTFDENIVVSIDRELKRRVEELARKEERPIGAMARLLIREALDNWRGTGSERDPEPAASSA